MRGQRSGCAFLLSPAVRAAPFASPSFCPLLSVSSSVLASVLQETEMRPVDAGCTCVCSGSSWDWKARVQTPPFSVAYFGAYRPNSLWTIHFRSFSLLQAAIKGVKWDAH
jgi:hypothetical protein